MASRLPPFIALRALEAAARRQSYSAAADELGVTHGAVSQQIRRLEEELGLALFQRRGNRMVPTPAAARLASEVARSVERLHRAVDEFRADGADLLVVSTVPHFAQRWLTPRLARFSEAIPGVRLEIRSDTRLADFVTDGVDVAVRLKVQDSGWGDLERRLLFNDVQYPVCSPELARRHDIRTPEDLVRAPLLIHRERPWLPYLKALGLETAEEPRGGMIFDETGLMIEAAAQGLGVALARSPFADHYLESGRLIRPLSQTRVEGFGYFVCWRRDSRKLPLIEAFADWMVAEVAPEDAAA